MAVHEAKAGHNPERGASMADGRDPKPAFNLRSIFPWFEIFRCFQLALDPRKLLVAAAGILVMSFAWWLLSIVFWYKAPSPTDADYSTTAILKEYGDKKNPKTNLNYTEEDAKNDGAERYLRDLEEWKTLNTLAGPGGKLRTFPWNEYRGPNPFLFVTDMLSGSAADRVNSFTEFMSGTVPVLVEPLVKMLLPIVKIISPGVSGQTKVYLLLILMSNIAVWAFCGGVISRIAAVQIANKGPISLRQAIKFVAKRYLGYLGSPALPLGVIALAALGIGIYAFFGTVFPFVGDLFVFGLGLPVVIIGGAVMAIFLVGLAGYPLMFTTLSAEGDQSDTFDALSRSINYVYQSPWNYIWYWLVAIVYGAIVTLFVLFFTSLTVYVGKWAAGLPASQIWSDRKPDYLFIYAPESFGWKELLTKDSPYAVRGQWEKPNINYDRPVYTYHPVNKELYDQKRAEYYAYNSWGAWIVCFWLTLIFLVMLGFTYSFFWSAATMIYFLMRKKVDESEMDEVFVEEDEPPLPPASPKIAEGTSVPATSPTSLPVIASPLPPSVPPIPPTLPPIPAAESPPPATIPFNPLADGPKKDEPPPTV
jgi:hypothetical protein